MDSRPPPREIAPLQRGATLVAVFAKFWTPGKVKTRLAATVGERAAAELHRQFVETTLAQIRGVGDAHWLVVTPPERQADFEVLPAVAANSFRIRPQSAGDLGQRMRNFFEEAFAEGHEHVVLIGADTPDLPTALVTAALDRLKKVPVVLGPSTDGGYYLVGVAGRVPPIFDGIEWSTASVLADTMQRLNVEQIEFTLLEEWSDVDEWEDLVALHERLSKINVSVDEPLAQLRSAVANRLIQ